MSSENQTTEHPVAVYTNTVSFPGIPIESVVAMISTALTAAGVTHELNVSVLDTMSLATGNSEFERKNMESFINLNNIMDSLVREHRLVTCKVQSTNVFVKMTFNCYN